MQSNLTLRLQPLPRQFSLLSKSMSVGLVFEILGFLDSTRPHLQPLPAILPIFWARSSTEYSGALLSNIIWLFFGIFRLIAWYRRVSCQLPSTSDSPIFFAVSRALLLLCNIVGFCCRIATTTPDVLELLHQYVLSSPHRFTAFTNRAAVYSSADVWMQSRVSTY